MSKPVYLPLLSMFALPFRDGIHVHARECKMTLDDGYKHQPVPGLRTLSSIETMFSLLCLDGERVEGQVRGSRAWKGGVDVQTLEEVHVSSVRQAEQRNNEEGHGAKRGVRGLYKLGQRVLRESPHRTSPRNAICSSLPTNQTRSKMLFQSSYCTALSGWHVYTGMIQARECKINDMVTVTRPFLL